MTAAQFVERVINVSNNSPTTGLRSPGRSCSTYLLNYSWAHTLDSFKSLSVIPDILVIQVTLVILGFLVPLASHPSQPSDSSQSP